MSSSGSHSTHGEHAGEVHHEPLPVKAYVAVFLSLIVLTGVTVWVAQFDFGPYNMLIAMAVAVTKASLVVLYFMNLRYEPDRVNVTVFLTGLLFLLIFIVPTMGDILTRGTLDKTRGEYDSQFRAATQTPPAGDPAQPKPASKVP